MKTLHIIMALLCSSTLFFSCKKDSEDIITNPNNQDTTLQVSGVDSGHAALALTTNPAFYGSTSYNVSNTTSTWAFSQTSMGVRQVEVKTIDSSGNTSKTIFLFMVFPKTVNTSTGNITIDFSNTASNPYTARLVMAYTVGSSQSPDFTSLSGNVIMTRLTDREVAGTFQGVVTDTLGNHITVTGGNFAGRF